MKPKLVIWGAAGHALVVADIIRLRGEYEIVGFLDNVNVDRHRQPFCGATILGGQEQLDPLREQGVEYIFLGFGRNTARLKLAALARARGFQLATAIHPQAVIASDVIVGAGTAIMAGAVINPSVHLGENVIINTSASLDHECVIEDGVHISPGVHLAGQVHVGRMAWIGIGAVVADKIIIGAHSIVGAGAVVITAIPDRVVAYGVPAKVTRSVTTDE